MSLTPRSKREKAPVDPVLRSIDEVNDALKEICQIDVQSSRINAKTDERLNKIKAVAEEELKPLLSRRGRLAKDIEEYCVTNRADIFTSGRKTVELTFGEINFRQHPPAVKITKKGAWTVAKVIDKIKSLFADKADDLIRTKEELNREALVVLDAKDLAQVGLEIERKETFGFTPYTEKLSEQMQARPSGARVIDAGAGVR